MSNHFSNLKAHVIQDPKPNAWRVLKQYMNNTLTCQTAFLVRVKPQQNKNNPWHTCKQTPFLFVLNIFKCESEFKRVLKSAEDAIIYFQCEDMFKVVVFDLDLVQSFYGNYSDIKMYHKRQILILICTYNFIEWFNYVVNINHCSYKIW